MALQRYPHDPCARCRHLTVKTIAFSEHNYRVPRLTPWEAFHVMRRLSPVFVGVGPQILGLALADSEEARAAGLLGAVFGEGGMRFAQILSMLPDADVDFAAFTCLRGVTVEEGSSWARIMPEGATKPTFMFPFITLPVIMRLVTEVLKEELTDFLSAGRSSGVGQTQKTA